MKNRSGSKTWEDGEALVESAVAAGDVEAAFVEQRPRGHGRRMLEAFHEAYSPGRIVSKLHPVLMLRVAKAFALVLNAGIGRMFLGWDNGESRVLDFVGKGTERLYWDLYGRELTREESMAFLHRRLYFCVLTGFATLLQIIFSLAGLHIFSLLIALICLPITVLDRQWCTLVTRMQKLAVCLSRALVPVATTHGMPTRFGVSGFPMLLGGVEMVVAAAQVWSGCLIFSYTLYRALEPGAGVAADLLWSIVTLRVLKELCNVMSPLIELRRQPAQFARNDDCVRQADTPRDLALMLHEHEGSEEVFMYVCKALVGFVVCGRAGAAGRPKAGDVEMSTSARDEGDVTEFLGHVHGPDCLPAFLKGKWKGEKQFGMLNMMLEAGQMGSCYWASLHDHMLTGDAEGHHSDTMPNPEESADHHHYHAHSHTHGDHHHAHAHTHDHHHAHTHTHDDHAEMFEGHVHTHEHAHEHSHEHVHTHAGKVHEHVHVHVLPNGKEYRHAHNHCHDSIHTHEDHEYAHAHAHTHSQDAEPQAVALSVSPSTVTLSQLKSALKSDPALW